MSVRAKFRCNVNKDGMIQLLAVTTGSEENKTFWEYTPAGTITLQVINPEASNQFEAGKEYYVDFTQA